MLHPFDSWPAEDQTRFIDNLEQLRTTVERIKFYELAEAPDAEKQAAIYEFHERRRYLIGMIYELDAQLDGEAD